MNTLQNDISLTRLQQESRNQPTFFRDFFHHSVLNACGWIFERRTFSPGDYVPTLMSLFLFHSIPQSPHFIVGSAAGQAILRGFNQEYEQVGDDWEFGHVREISMPNSPATSLASYGADTHGS
jgi:hypothetical protein